ncbi:uncharacterized protein LOC129743756 [Uranotaenia lowii]|uniref:uncharacterized protein LOC129743756 n=1 Tax=Uranotaenia lowii TaxID=190385 RepID=UPI002478BE28|nr:uncharacterized protein LOC129743756 [Uranotaenia lowii]
MESLLRMFGPPELGWNPETPSGWTRFPPGPGFRKMTILWKCMYAMDMTNGNLHSIRGSRWKGSLSLLDFQELQRGWILAETKLQAKTSTTALVASVYQKPLRLGEPIHVPARRL